MRAAFVDLDVVHGGGTDRVFIGTNIGEHKVFAGKVIGSASVGVAADADIIQCTQFLTIHIQIDHVASVGIDLIGQFVGMELAVINAVISGTDAPLFMLATGVLTDGNYLAVSENIHIVLGVCASVG